MRSEFIIFRSSRPVVFSTKGVLRNFAKFIGKHLCQSLLFNKVAGLGLLAQVFSCEFCEISKKTLLTEHLRWLLLKRKLQTSFGY